jgi:AcrR family transcriptional regulator
MTSVDSEAGEQGTTRRPQRVDARRNYETLIAAARDTFAEDGVSASLEEIARRAGVGIGTLYRHFPTRQELFEGVYAHEVESLCRTAEELIDLPPWDALVGWLHHFVRYTATKRALAEVLVRDSEFFRAHLASVYAAGGKLLERAQAAGVARPDVSIDDVMRLISGITLVQFPEPGQLERVVGMGLDGLRVQSTDTP